MDFKDNLNELIKKIEKYKGKISNEEMTKTAFIMPFFDILGYDTRNPFEFHPEFTADVADFKGEKVDYAILINDEPQILIEAKDCNDKLEKHDRQLIRYFHTTKAKIAILTNGIIYKFFTDLDETNKMDDKPFLEIDLLSIKENEINELKKFFKCNFDIENILTTAEELKYSNAIKKLLKKELEDPSDKFLTYIIGEVYDGIKTQKIKDKFIGIVKNSTVQLINEIVRNRFEDALETKEKEAIVQEEVTEKVVVSEIITSKEELEALGIIKSLLYGKINDMSKIEYKDTVNYFNVLYEGNTRKWICRFYLNSNNKYISFPCYDENGNRITKENKILLENGINDIYTYNEILSKIIKDFENNI
jgi:hypothetical protein